MGVFNRVLPSLIKADENLAAQMTEAVTKREYSHLGDLAAVSEKVRAVIAEIERIEPTAPAAPKRAASKAEPEAPGKRRRSPPKRGYPKYSRRGDSLVRTLWSNTKNVEQTNAVPYATVKQIAATIVSDGSPMFRKSILAELTTPDGKRLPVHQVYLVLDWLLTSKAIRKKGRGDYIPNYAKLTADALRGSFNALSETGK